MKKMRSFNILYILLISILLTFCTPSQERPIIEIHLKDKKVAGNTGCNSMNGTVVVEADQIEFSDIVTTKMFCPESIEQKFLIALGMVNNYKIEKMKLYLYEDENEVMIFQRVD
jgi:putative lipoprotein